MLSKDKFYVISSICNDEGFVKAVIKINAAHKIFEGHFPGQPVVPGVCMMQIVKELLENVLNKKMRLVTADHLKFLSVINPEENNIAEIEFRYLINASGEVSLTANMLNNRATCFKMKALFKIV